MVWSRTQDFLFCLSGLCPGELTQIKIDFMFEFTIISHWRRLFKVFLLKSNGYFSCCILFKLCLPPESFAIWIDWQRIFIFIPIDQRYNAAAHLHDHCVVSLISYPVRSIKYDTQLIFGVISINIGAQFALIHQKMNGDNGDRALWRMKNRLVGRANWEIPDGWSESKQRECAPAWIFIVFKRATPGVTGGHFFDSRCLTSGRRWASALWLW